MAPGNAQQGRDTGSPATTSRVGNPVRRRGIKFQTLGEHEFDATMVIDRTGRIGFASPSVGPLFGVDIQRSVGTDLFALLEPASVRPMRDVFADLITGRRPSALLTIRAARPAGSPLTLEVVAVGNPDGVILSIRNVTERAELERRNRHQLQVQAAMVAALPDGLMSVDADGVIVRVNEAFEVMFVLPRVRILGRRLVDVLADDADAGLQLVDAEGGPLPHGEHPVLVTARGGRRSTGLVFGRLGAAAGDQWIRVSTRALIGPGDTVSGAVASFSDVTESHRSYLRVRREVERLRHILYGSEGALEVSTVPRDLGDPVGPGPAGAVADVRYPDPSGTYAPSADPRVAVAALPPPASPPPMASDVGGPGVATSPECPGQRTQVPVPVPKAASVTSSWIRSAGLLSLATVLISLGNYAYSLTVVRLLRPVEFSRFSAGQSVLLVLSNGGMAAIPWAVARYIVLEDGPRARSEALSFGLRASALLSLVAAGAAELILVGVAGIQVATVTAVGSALMFMVAGPVGFLQGTDRVDRLARFRILEVVVRVATGLLVVLLLSKTASWALVGFPVGAAVMLGVSLAACRDGWPLSRPHASASRSLMRQSIRLGAVQLALVSLGAIDAVAVLASHLPARQAASYLAASLIGRIPLFISTAVAIAAFAALTAARDDRDVADHMDQMLRFYGVLTVPVVIGCFTVPHRLLSLLIPSSYVLAPTLLKYTCLSGAAIGLINCITTAHQARGHIKAALTILLPATILQPILLIFLGRSAGIQAFCIGLVALSMVTAAVVTWEARRWLPVRRPAPRTVLLVAVTCALAVVAGRVHGPVVWMAVMVGLSGTAAAALLRSRSRNHLGGAELPS